MAVGAVLSQNKKPIEFYSRRFSATEQRYSTYEREALALVSSCLHFGTILIGRKFTVHTDHKPLCEWLHKKPANERHTRWLVKLQDMQFDIKYIEGKHNIVADCLSRPEGAEKLSYEGPVKNLMVGAVRAMASILDLKRVKELQTDEFIKSCQVPKEFLVKIDSVFYLSLIHI